MRKLMIILGLLVTTSTSASAQACNPRDFFDIDFSSLRDYERLIVYSAISEDTFKKSAAAHRGEMIIPYINVPAKSDFQYTKTIVNQMKSILNVNLETQQEETILSSSLSQLGANAYVECLKGRTLTVEVPPTAIYDEDVLVEIRFNGPGNDPGQVEPPLISGGTLVGTPPTVIQDEKATLLGVKRDPTKKLVLGLVVNGEIAQIAMPPRPTKTLVFKPFILPEGGAPLAQNSDKSTGYGPHEKTECYNAPEGWTFITATALPVIESLHGADMGSSFTVNAPPDGLRVCARAFANTGVKNRGGFASGRISVIAAKLKNINELQTPADTQ